MVVESSRGVSGNFCGQHIYALNSIFWSIVVGSQYGNNNKSLQSLIVKLMLVKLEQRVNREYRNCVIVYEDNLDLGPWNCNFFNTDCLTFSITSFACVLTHIFASRNLISRNSLPLIASLDVQESIQFTCALCVRLSSLGCVFFFFFDYIE